MNSLFHYEKFCPEYLQDLLVNNRVHMSSAAGFNDPWDCRPWADSSELEDPELKLRWASFFHEFLQPGEAIPDELSWPRTIQLMVERVWRQNEERWRIYCLTPHADSVLMWSHYGDNHRGICLEFNPRTFKQLKKVQYRKDLSKISIQDLERPGDQLFTKVLLNKASCWAYEHENRALARTDSSPGSNIPVVKDNYLCLQAGTLTSVIVGCRGDLNAVRRIVGLHAPKLPIKVCKRDPSEYQLNIVDVD